MRVRVNNDKAKEYSYGQGDLVEPLPHCEDLLMVVDPGKTNMAILLGTIWGETVAIYELSGTGEDTTDYCLEFEQFYKDLLKNNNIIELVMEKTILKKKSEGKNGDRMFGMQYYHSNQVLNEIRSNMIRLSLSLTGKKPYELNNWVWKSATLPKEYRGHNEKGSHRHLVDLDPRYEGYSHDVTDVIHMYAYVISNYRHNIELVCREKEKSKHDYALSIVDKSVLPETIRAFTFNDDFSCEENAVYYTNRCLDVGACKLPINLLNAEDIYKYSSCLTTHSTPYLLVYRK